MDINVTCINCGRNEVVTLSDAEVQGYSAWQNGRTIQEALPTLHMMYREVLITHMCCDCLSKIYNSPKPGEDWGEQIGECNTCGASIYNKDGSTCPCCHQKWREE